MAAINFTFTKSDGIFTNQMNPNNINWTDYAFGGNSSKKLNKANLGTELTDIIGIDSNEIWLKKYDESTLTWTSVDSRLEIDNTYGWNIILADDGIYLARDTQIDKMPNYLTRTLYISRITASITKDNFDNYKTVRTSDSEGASRYIPIGPSRTFGSGDPSTALVSIKKDTDLAGTHIYITTDLSFKATNPLYTYNDGGIPFPKAVCYWKEADTTIQDLETRVSILETKVSDLTTRLEQVERNLKDLPAVVAAVSANVSKNYVAR